MRKYYANAKILNEAGATLGYIQIAYISENMSVLRNKDKLEIVFITTDKTKLNGYKKDTKKVSKQ